MTFNEGYTRLTAPLSGCPVAGTGCRKGSAHRAEREGGCPKSELIEFGDSKSLINLNWQNGIGHKN